MGGFAEVKPVRDNSLSERWTDPKLGYLQSRANTMMPKRTDRREVHLSYQMTEAMPILKIRRHRGVGIKAIYKY